jgi:alkylhydroperoxidase family enzyme
MPLIKAHPPKNILDKSDPMFAADLEENGFVPNSSLLFSGRPEVFAAWRELQRCVRAPLSPRRYELIVFAAALALKSTYAAWVQAVSLSQFFSPAELETLAMDYRKARLETVEVAVMDFAQKIVLHASKVTPSDIQWLLSLGVSEAEIGDITLASAAQCFLSKVVDGLAAEPDPPQRDLDPDLRSALSLGRHFD